MRLAILADIHANLPALEAALADIDRQRVDGIAVAGDMLVGGPRPQETLRPLRSRGALMIRGNNENYLVDYHSGRLPESWRSSRQWASVRWTYARLDRESLDFLASLPLERTLALPGGEPIRILHGSPQGPTGRLFPHRDPARLHWFRIAGLLYADEEAIRLDRALAGVAERVLVCAHTHIPWQQQEDGHLAFNPGSAGQPLDGAPAAQYALLTQQGSDWHVELRSVPYDLERTRAAFHESGLLAEVGGFARACLLGSETGLNVPGHFVAYAYRLAAQAGCGDGETLPDAIWDEAAASFDWRDGSAPAGTGQGE